MKQPFILLFILVITGCTSDEYQQTFEKRVSEIKELYVFDNTPVTFSDSLRVRLFSSPSEIFNAYHPYQFLRDTARTEDLISLLDQNDHILRTYAFAALVNRDVDLFPIILQHLSDSIKMDVVESDYGYRASSADMMLQHVADRLTPIQKDSIAKLLLSKFSNLETTKEVLLFQDPIPELYEHIKRIAKKGNQGKFALVALSRYQNIDDLDLISEGFRMTDYYNGHKVFFMAIEEYTHQTFKDQLINFKTSINKGYDNQGHDFYFNALAKYHDPECLAVIREFVEVEDYASEFYKLDNLRMIRRALKKYYSPEYQPLISQIESKFEESDDVDYYDDYLFRSPWNY